MHKLIKLSHYRTKLLGTLAILLVTSLSLTSFAQSSPSKPRDLRFSHMGIKEGLSQSTIYAIMQDRQDYLWFATLDGLNKFDGHRVTIYRHDPNNINSLSRNYVHSLYEDDRGIIWIGTNNALTRFDPVNETFQHYKPNQSAIGDGRENSINSITQEGHDSLWIGTRTGLHKFDIKNEAFSLYNRADGIKTLAHQSITALHIDKNNTLWVGTENGLAKLNNDTGEFTLYQHQAGLPSSLSHNRITEIYEDSYDQLWIGTQGGLNILNRKTDLFTTFLHDTDNSFSISDDNISSIVEDHNGTLWIATLNGLNQLRRDDYSFAIYKHDPANPYSLASEYILSLYEDNNNILWIGTRAAGLSKLDPSKNGFNNYTVNPGSDKSLSGRSVRAATVDHAGNLWVGTYAGVDKFNQDRKVIARYQHDPKNSNSVLDKIVRIVIEDSTHAIWIGTTKGLSKLDPVSNKFTHYLHDENNPDSIINNNLRSAYIDSKQQLWFGTNKGLSRFDKESQTFKNYSYNADNLRGLSGESIRSIFEDRKGRLWIGTDGGLSLYHLETDDFTQYLHKPDDLNTPSQDTIYSITEDSHGILWIGTPAGLNRFNPETNQFTHFREKDGLGNDTVYSVLVDHNDSVWSATNRGLSLFDQRTQTFRNFTESSGLQGDEFNAQAEFRDPKTGELYFGGVSGLTSFHPDNIKSNSRVPRINITGFKLSNQRVTTKASTTENDNTTSNFTLDQSILYTDKIILPHDRNDFSFEFAAMDFSEPDKNQYAYQLVGYDENWIHNNTQRQVTYTNIDPGQYTFRVKGSNNDNVWNEEGRSIQIFITAPWWSTIWFRVSAIIFIILLIITSVHWRMLSIARYNRTLRNGIEEKTAELKSAQKALMAQAHRAGMAEISSSVLHNIGNVLNSVNISCEALHQQLKKLKHGGLQKIVELLSAEIIEHKIAPNSKLALLPTYLEKLTMQMQEQQSHLIEESSAVRKHIEHIKHIIAIQQTTARSSSVQTAEQADTLLNEALQLSLTKLTQHNIQVIKEYRTRASIIVDKHKTLMIIINLISNAIDAMLTNPVENRILKINTFIKNNMLTVEVIDNGIGMNQATLDRLFQHGFTTKQDGHGFGLHSSALATKQLHGSLTVDSAGEGRGAVFTLSLPVSAAHDSQAA